MSLNAEALLELACSTLDYTYLLSDKEDESAAGRCFSRQNKIVLYYDYIDNIGTATHEIIHAIQFKWGYWKTIADTNEFLDKMGLPKPDINEIKARWGNSYSELEYAAVALQSYPELIKQVLLKADIAKLKKTVKKQQPKQLNMVGLSILAVVLGSVLAWGLVEVASSIEQHQYQVRHHAK